MIVAQTVSGRTVDLLDPRPEHIHWPDLGEMLAKQQRFAGATRGVHYGVAQHSLLVVDLLPASFREARPYALLHDAHEAVLGDWTTPVKQALAELGGGRALDRLESRMARACHQAAGLYFPPPPLIEAAVREADLAALATEKRDLLASCAIPWGEDLPAPARTRIRPLAWPDAMDRFLAAVRILCPEARL